MKRRFLWLIGIALITVGTQVLAQRRESRVTSPPDVGESGWLTSLEEGKAEARASGMPLMVVIRCQP